MAVPMTDDVEKTLDTAPTTDGKKPEKPQQQLDGGWRAWSAVFSAFLQACISLGLREFGVKCACKLDLTYPPANSFGVYQSEYALDTYRNSSTAVSRWSKAPLH